MDLGGEMRERNFRFTWKITSLLQQAEVLCCVEVDVGSRGRLLSERTLEAAARDTTEVSAQNLQFFTIERGPRAKCKHGSFV